MAISSPLGVGETERKGERGREQVRVRTSMNEHMRGRELVRRLYFGGLMKGYLLIFVHSFRV